MCFAPRYRSGPMARPFSPCRNTASLPETPCASRPAASAHTMSAVNAAASRQLPAAGLLPLISCMARIACLIEFAARLHDSVLIFCVGSLERLSPPVHIGTRHLDPVSLVDRAIAHEEKVSPLDDRR